MIWKVHERYIPLDGDRVDDAHEALDLLRSEYADNPHVLVVGMVETRSLAHRTPHTTAKWCALLREAKKETP